MPVVIRLAKIGRKSESKYRLAVADSRRFRDCKFLEYVGYYNAAPSENEEGLKLDQDRITYWMSKGAQPTVRVKSILKEAVKK